MDALAERGPDRDHGRADPSRLHARYGRVGSGSRGALDRRDSPGRQRTRPLTLQLGKAGLRQRSRPTSAKIDGRRIVGLTKPEWLDRPPVEQSLDDARSLVFDTARSNDALEILGVPTVRLRVGADRRIAHLAARLTEVDPPTGAPGW